MVINSRQWTVGGCISARRFSYGQILAISRRYCRPTFLPEGENRKCKSSPGCMLIPTRSDVKCRRIMAVARVTVPIFRMYRRPTSESGWGLRRCSGDAKHNGMAWICASSLESISFFSTYCFFAICSERKLRLISGRIQRRRINVVDNTLPVSPL